MSQASGGPAAAVWLLGLNVFLITAILLVPAFWWASAHDVPPPIQHHPTVATIAIGSELLGWGLVILWMVRLRRFGTKHACLAIYERGFCIQMRSSREACMFDEIDSIQLGRKPPQSGFAKTLDVAVKTLKPAHHEFVRVLHARLALVTFLDRNRKDLLFSTVGYEDDDVQLFWEHVARRMPHRLFMEGRPM